MASYRGVPIFGRAVSVAPALHAREAQLNTFFGLSGVERLDGGDRGGELHVSGVSAGEGLPGLAASEQLFLSFKDGRCGTLVDQCGTAWQNAVLETFVPEGRIRQHLDGTCYRVYRAVFSLLGSVPYDPGPSDPTPTP